jgi:hypothetical protein
LIIDFFDDKHANISSIGAIGPAKIHSDLSKARANSARPSAWTGL